MRRRRRKRIRLVKITLLFVLGLGLFLGLNKEDEKDEVIEKPLPKKEKTPEYAVIKDTLKRGESVYLSLKENDIPNAQIVKLTDAMGEIFNLRKSRPGDWYSLTCDSTNQIKRFKYHQNSNIFTATRKKGGFIVETQKLNFSKLVRAIRGEVSSSLWESILKLGERPELVFLLTDLFRWQIDFLTEPREGDEFAILFEEYRHGGKFVKYGKILAAKYKDVSGFFYRNPEGRSGYYNARGKSLKKAFLRSPLNYRRISSRYSYHRFHPIFHRYMPHLGIDYAAPTGTPVVASAEGIVVYVGWKRGFGRFIKINHGNGYYTTYGHLSRYARGIKRGIEVKQGQVIGYVGQTGIATGPHLDYRLIKNGSYVNPLTVDIPAAGAVKPKYLSDYYKVRDRLLEALEFLSQKSL